MQPDIGASRGNKGSEEGGNGLPPSSHSDSHVPSTPETIRKDNMNNIDPNERFDLSLSESPDVEKTPAKEDFASPETIDTAAQFATDKDTGTDNTTSRYYK